MTLVDALRCGSLRDQLVALRDHLAERLETAPDRDAAPIAAQLRQVVADLDAMPLTGEASDVDEVAARRAARRAGASAS